MSKKRIVIKGGEVCGFVDEVSFRGLDVQVFSQQRVSRIVPTSWLLMSAFLVIRKLCSDDSKLAAWTRRWGCEWKVLIDGKTYGPFQSRSAAILFEKDKIYQQGKLFNAK
ncbi:hypothetical protein U876_23830 [Aeromonas hydrophila NJ-35]|uniref:hypothetical protein n=1 Tax=Aeromonas TaxID=642 RepID=UPI000640A754|nr:MULTISPECIES: hypothetical protein [Aeromonas]AKJ36878.1 hypothetical protein U876_23830 [Aeromonas hydrophila NJ-35]ALZ82585.1 hypothetical protein AhyD4_23540 [Aeromonas hydrophila]QGW99127.1 hypothetical protein FGM04_21535 [Aeromonas veronii]HDK8695652.1 hypothetical protein [Aeromonas hydrophila]